MAKFITFNDGLQYINTDEIRSFEHSPVEGADGKLESSTLFYMKGGQTIRYRRAIDTIAPLFETVNLKE